MGLIGGYSFARIADMPLALAGVDLEVITRKGVPGKALWPSGITADPKTVECVYLLGSLGAIGVAVTNFAALKGTIVTVVDDLGNTYYNVWVKNQRPIRQFKPLASTNAAVAYVLIHEFELECLYAG